MDRRSTIFVALIGAQAAHSLEEYVGRLYDVLAPAVFVSGLFSADHRRGFVVFNVALFAFGVVCFLGPIRRRWSSAVVLAGSGSASSS